MSERGGDRSAGGGGGAGKSTPGRWVHVAEALGWLRERTPIAGASVVASIPDRSEFPALSLAEWKAWFLAAAACVLDATPPDGVSIFFQSDIKTEGEWVDKGFLCLKAAEASGARLLWHKIALRVPAGAVTFGRPAYSHLLAFSRGIEAPVARSTADVFSVGEKNWPRGMGIAAARMICSFIREETRSSAVVNPFCGTGSVLAMANHLGLDAVGVEMSARRAEKARGLFVRGDGSGWRRSEADLTGAEEGGP